jgi:hypothetical protein
MPRKETGKATKATTTRLKQLEAENRRLKLILTRASRLIGSLRAERGGGFGLPGRGRTPQLTGPRRLRIWGAGPQRLRIFGAGPQRLRVFGTGPRLRGGLRRKPQRRIA